jgi:type I restriction enzyme S subunit
MDGLLNISKTNFFTLQIPVPYSKEQSKIANFLTAIDDKIEKVAELVEASEKYKKGLLQRMFV